MPRVAQEAPPPPRLQAERAPRRASTAQAMLEARNRAAGCLKRNRVRERQPAVGTRHAEERRARCEALLLSIG
eukprot:2578305-Alexandrium_andersonii.AAC.1